MRTTEEKIAALTALRDEVVTAIEQHRLLLARTKSLIEECLSEEADAASE